MASGIPNIPRTFNIRRNDREPDFEVDIFDLDGDPFVPASVSSVVFTMRARDGTLKINRQAASLVVGADVLFQNRLRFQWGATDTDTSGDYGAEFEILFTSGKKRTFPATPEQSLTIKIHDDLDAT